MSFTATGKRSASAKWLHGLWEYYREYTHTAIHAASAAALTAFGLLVFVDRLFVILAIAAYVCPPVVLYSIDADVGKSSASSKTASVRADPESNAKSDSTTNDGDTDSDSDDGDTDSDSDDGDSDSDGDDGDTDSDGTDADADGADADADGADADG